MAGVVLYSVTLSPLLWTLRAGVKQLIVRPCLCCRSAPFRQGQNLDDQHALAQGDSKHIFRLNGLTGPQDAGRIASDMAGINQALRLAAGFDEPQIAEQPVNPHV